MFEAMENAGRLLTGKSPPLRGIVSIQNGTFEATTSYNVDDKEVRVYGESTSSAVAADQRCWAVATTSKLDDLKYYLKDLRGVDFTSPPFPEVVARTWTDKTGSFQIKAKMIDAAEGKVTLLTSSNKTIEVPFESLSAADQTYALDIFKRVFVPMRPFKREDMPPAAP